MAKKRCKCGSTLRDDDPDDGMLLLTRREFDVDMDSSLLFGQARELLRCSTCGRLWIFWIEGGAPVEYVKVSE
jgi:hypothetical protein